MNKIRLWTDYVHGWAWGLEAVIKSVNPRQALERGDPILSSMVDMNSIPLRLEMHLHCTTKS